MKVAISNKLLFSISVIVGALVFAVSEAEPWDSLYGWIGMMGLGIVLVPFTVPALVGSFVGFAVRKALDSVAQEQRPG